MGAIRLSSRRRLALSQGSLARGQSPNSSSRFLPSKLIGVGPPMSIQQSHYDRRREYEEIEKQIEAVKIQLSQLETQRIKEMIDLELKKDFPVKTKADVFNYFYIWNIEEYFFGLVHQSECDFASKSYHQYNVAH